MKLIFMVFLEGVFFLNMIFGNVIDVWILVIGSLLLIMLLGVNLFGLVVDDLIVRDMFEKEFGFIWFDWIVIFGVIMCLEDCLLDSGRFVVILFNVWRNLKELKVFWVIIRGKIIILLNKVGFFMLVLIGEEICCIVFVMFNILFNSYMFSGWVFE